ncbi:hypothetical protein OOK27_05345 [Streptomyces canus]|nr:hypothetical protein [Streptomyces canus]MCX5253598.1 hypothetical protein [Streptomyces canus]
MADLGELMAGWLEGDLTVWPGYAVSGPDDETAGLIPVLARVNRAGFVTDQSQPGCDGPGHDGARWEQRAAVSGLVADQGLMLALARVAEAHRLTILVRGVDDQTWIDGVTATRVGGEDYTSFGARLTHRDLRHIWRGVSGTALDAIAEALQVTLIDPEYGRNDRLWTALDEALDLAAAA